MTNTPRTADDIFDPNLPHALGLGRPTDGGGPAVNTELLVQYATDQLDDSAAVEVESLIAKYAAWHDAFQQTALSE